MEEEKRIKKDTILVFLICISFIFGFICYINITFPNEVIYRWEHSPANSDYVATYEIPKTDYYNGLWLIGGMLGFIFLLIYFDVPIPTIDDFFIYIKKRLLPKKE